MLVVIIVFLYFFYCVIIVLGLLFDGIGRGVFMFNFLKVVDRNGECWLLLVFYVMFVLIMFIEVVWCEVFVYLFIWGEEIVCYFFIYFVWIGVVVVVKECGYICIDVLM